MGQIRQTARTLPQITTDRVSHLEQENTRGVDDTKAFDRGDILRENKLGIGSWLQQSPPIAVQRELADMEHIQQILTQLGGL